MVKGRHSLIIDFDSTFIKVEAFDVLCKLCYPDEAERVPVLAEVGEITALGVNGSISITHSLKQRLRLLKPHRRHIPQLVELLRGQVSTSFKNNRAFLKEYAHDIYIVSNGFFEFILPVVTEYGILPTQVYGNTFVYDRQGNITGFDDSNPLSAEKGKVQLVSTLGLQNSVVVIGDGYTDYEIKAAGLAQTFYAFTENISRDSVTSKTPYIATSLDRVISDLANHKPIEQSTIETLKKTG